MHRRLELQMLLETIMGSRNVYFQPPASVSLSYPAIVYAFDGIKSNYSNDKKYSMHDYYDITLIQISQDLTIIDKLLMLDYCEMHSHYVVDNLYHYKFKLFF